MLRHTLTPLVAQSAEPACATALVVPHGSLRQSGAIAAAAIRQVHIPRRCIMLGPFHAGNSMRWSLMARGAYRTPLGIVPIDEAIALAVLEACPFLEADDAGQRGEHAIEVVLPFLQMAGPSDLSLVPILTRSDDVEELGYLSTVLAQLIRSQPEGTLLIASSDLSHYEESKAGAAKDEQLLKLIQALDGPMLVRQVQGGLATICGYAPVACVLMAARFLGATGAEVAAYGTSAQAGGDPHSTIGYAGIIIR